MPGLPGADSDLGGGKTPVIDLPVKCGEDWRAVGRGAACATVARSISGHTADDADTVDIKCSATGLTLTKPITSGARVDTAKVFDHLR